MNTFKWLIRREFWESRTAWVAPVATALILIAVTLLGLFYGIEGSFSGEILGQINTSSVGVNDAAIAGLVVIAATFFVVLQISQYAYLADCLYSERKDRSILFWKSLPISDRATVLSKLFFALVVMPVLAACCVLITQVVVYAAASIKLGMPAQLLSVMWAPATWAKAIGFGIFECITAELWALPLMAWVLMVSAFAPRSPTLIALLVPAGAAFVENLLFGTSRIGAWVIARMGMPQAVGSSAKAIGISSKEGLMFTPPDIAGILTNPSLWIGLGVAALLVAGAIEIRRRRDPSA